MKLFDIGEDGKVVVALWIAEKMLIDINNKDENYIYCRESVGSLAGNGYVTYNIDMGKVIGTNGEINIKIVTNGYTNKIIFAYPIP